MQKVQPKLGPPALLVSVLLALTACDRPQGSGLPSGPEDAILASVSLLECPSDVTLSTSGAVGVLGGVVSLAGTLVSVPPEALLAPVTVDIEIPASRYMLVDLGVNGQDHWQFLASVAVTIDYSRCRVGLLEPPVTVWHVDPQTGALLEHMGGVDNRLLQKVTFLTDHFSGYAIAN